LAPASTFVFAPGAGVLAIHELTWTRGNSAGPSVDADAIASRLSAKATVTPNLTEYRINLWAKNSADEWVFTTAPYVSCFFGRTAVMKIVMSMCGNSHLVSSWCQNQKGIVDASNNSSTTILRDDRKIAPTPYKFFARAASRLN